MDRQPTLEASPEDLRDLATDWFDDHDLPGGSVAVVDGTETVLATGFGNRDRDAGAPATADTLFGVGSATKPVTATAVLCLVDRGDLGLDDAVPDYVSFFEDAPGDPVTVRDLLSHTSGMPADDSDALVFADQVLGLDVGPSLDDWATFETFVAESTSRRLVDRERFCYYNSGYAVLARLVEAATGDSFATAVEDAVFDPLGMDDATFDPGVLDDGTAEAMTPYLQGETGLEAASFPDTPVFEPAGGLLASARDLAAFLAAQVEGGPHLDDALRDAGHEPSAVATRYVDGTEVGYGFGWESRPFGDDVLVGHSGNTGVSAGYVGFLRDRGLGVAVGCNAVPGESPEVLAVELLAALTGRDSTSVLPGSAIEAQVAPLPGRYESATGVHSATVTRDGSRLVVDHETPLGEQTMAFSPTSLDPEDREFTTVEDDGSLTTAEFFASGETVELLVDRVLLERVGEATVDGG